MSHPKNRHERKVVGKNKSKKRVPDFVQGEDFESVSAHYRNTTKPCSCSMCGNPRKFFGEKSIQEKRNECQ